MVAPKCGEIWWGELPDEARRPYLVLTRDEAIPVLRRILVAPVTRNTRSIPSELALGAGDGLKVDCVASMDNITVVPKACLIDLAGAVSRARRHELCAALSAAVNC